MKRTKSTPTRRTTRLWPLVLTITLATALICDAVALASGVVA